MLSFSLQLLKIPLGQLICMLIYYQRFSNSIKLVVFRKFSIKCLKLVNVVFQKWLNSVLKISQAFYLFIQIQFILFSFSIIFPFYYYLYILLSYNVFYILLKTIQLTSFLFNFLYKDSKPSFILSSAFFSSFISFISSSSFMLFSSSIAILRFSQSFVIAFIASTSIQGSNQSNFNDSS
ncbi:hypothetical protein IMG5_186960 [Ichthyophthirius multifiliis]|uniref:Transmembrane protein n=1 Tax=Ichthyophthirius multifiliis TaxID=5932 RepID=G0R3Q2_ICHMU|nr:hypothetical protein IMG5_186960 [Ichthyophthirius multifiliis]EGR27907.1 hypothetical protein IMG5_186960 [Ichthyophthirius multifiliis]|eukprot:XP_004027252.1 hypothetical protein IMG5_186960 [Ichthyophthirius multifiliis]